MSKILVMTGATGKRSGGYFAKLIGKNINDVKEQFPDGIRAIVRSSSDTSDLVKEIPCIEIITGDVADASTLKLAFHGADTVVHVAGIHWSKEIVDAAISERVRRLILVHTTGVYSKYKKAGETYRKIDEYVYKYCKENGVILSILRPTMIYGNTTDNNVIVFIKMVDKLPIMPVVNGARYELQPVHYKDLGEAYYKVLMNEGVTANKDYILSGGAPILLRDMLKVIGDNLGKKVRFISCPFVLAYIAAWLLYGVSIKRIDYREKVQRLCEPRIYSHYEAEKDFGYRPKSFDIGVVDEVKEYLLH